jgi:hypothetical protein
MTRTQTSVPQPTPDGHAAAAVQPVPPRSASADQARWLALLQQAMQDTGWTIDALAMAWNVDRAYAWRLVNGEKPFSVERLLALPDDLEARFEALRAESFGAIVVARVDESTALAQLASGVLNLVLTSSLPARATAMAKAELPRRADKANLR